MNILKFLGYKTSEQIYKEQYNRGYDWAAGNLLRGEITPEYIEGQTCGHESEPFDRGALDAMLEIEKLKPTKLDGLYYKPSFKKNGRIEGF